MCAPLWFHPPRTPPRCANCRPRSSHCGTRFADGTIEGGWELGTSPGLQAPTFTPGIAPDATFIPVRVCEPIGCFGSAINAGQLHHQPPETTAETWGADATGWGFVHDALTAVR